MQLEALQILTDWFNDVAYGVNVKLAGVPRTAGDSVPAQLQLIADETRNLEAAIGRMPADEADYPCLLLSQPPEGNALDPHGHVGIRDSSITLWIRYGAMTAAAAAGTSAWHYTMRAIERSLEELFRQDDSARELNSVQLYFIEAATTYPADPMTGDKVITGALQLRLRMRDIAPVS